MIFFMKKTKGGGRHKTLMITKEQRSDHRPVTATYMVEVHTFSPRKLQRALTFTHAEIENEQVITNYTKH